MDTLIHQAAPWLAPTLFGVCSGALAYVLFHALREAMEGYGDLYAEDAARQMEDVFLFIPARRIVELAAVCGVAGFVVCFFLFGHLNNLRGVAAGSATGLIGGLAALQVPRLVLRLLKRRRLERFNQQLVEALSTMSNGLRAGFSILQTFEQVVQEGQNPIAQEFGVFLHQTRVGVRIEDALRQLEERVGSEDLALMVRAVETARLTGGSLTDVFEKIATTIRERLRIQGRIHSLTAQGRLQGLVVGAMPLLLFFALSAMDPAMMTAFLGSRAGLSLLAAVVLLETAGAVFIRRIVRIDV